MAVAKVNNLNICGGGGDVGRRDFRVKDEILQMKMPERPARLQKLEKRGNVSEKPTTQKSKFLELQIQPRELEKGRVGDVHAAHFHRQQRCKFPSIEQMNINRTRDDKLTVASFHIAQQSTVRSQILNRPTGDMKITREIHRKQGSEFDRDPKDAIVGHPFRSPNQRVTDLEPLQIREAVGHHEQITVVERVEAGARQGPQRFRHPEAEDPHGGAGEVGLGGEAEGLEWEGGDGEVADEAVDVRVGVGEGDGAEAAESGVKGVGEGGGGDGWGGEGEGGAEEVGEGEEALACQGDGFEVAVVVEAAEYGLPALVRQVFTRPRRRHLHLRRLLRLRMVGGGCIAYIWFDFADTFHGGRVPRWFSIEI